MSGEEVPAALLRCSGGIVALLKKWRSLSLPALGSLRSLESPVTYTESRNAFIMQMNIRV